MGRWLISGLLLAMGVSCSSTADGRDALPSAADESFDSPASSADATGSGHQPAVVDASTTVESSDVATVLDFNMGGGDLSVCQGIEHGVADAPEVAPGVFLAAGFDEAGNPGSQGAIGHLASVCLDGWSSRTSGQLRGPGGLAIDLPGVDETSSEGAVTLHRSSVSSAGYSTIDVATLPGGPLGEYTIDLVDADNEATVVFTLASAFDSAWPRLFVVDRYDYFYGGQEDPVPGEPVQVGLVGYEPGTDVNVTLHRSRTPQSYFSIRPTGFVLVAETSVRVDDRGEAMLSVTLDTSSLDGDHCYVFSDAEWFQSGSGSEMVSLGGGDPGAFCVASQGE